jgi:hypothetical protein
MENSNPRQCKECWVNYLSPTVSRKSWNEKEDVLLLQKIAEYGPLWVQMKQYFPGRTDANLKNRSLVLV